MINASRDSVAILPQLTELREAYNQGVEDAKCAIRAESQGGGYWAATYINAIARRCSPHVYVNRVSASLGRVCITDNRTEEIRSRLNRFGRFTPTEDDVRYLLSRLDAGKEEPLEDRLSREQVVQAITDIQEARESHVQWANHLRNEKHTLCDGCDQFAAHIGDVAYHDDWIAKYDNVIKVLSSPVQ